MVSFREVGYIALNVTDTQRCAVSTKQFSDLQVTDVGATGEVYLSVAKRRPSQYRSLSGSQVKALSASVGKWRSDPISKSRGIPEID